MRPFRPLLALVAVLALVMPAQAAFHLMKVVEVFAGTPAAPNAKYVVLQMYAANQGAVSGHKITLFNAAGTLTDTFTFGATPTNPQSTQEKILIATPEAVAFFGVAADLTMNANLMAAGGKVCFDAIPEDCVAWGAYTGSSSGVGTPFAASTGIPVGRAAVRRLDVAGSPTLLEATDDTDQCSTDFLEGFPAPRNSNAVSGTIPASTCGNGAIEGVEQCDDNNTANGDSCSSVCVITTPLPTLSIDDVAISEGNTGTRLATFTVSLSTAAAGPVTYDIATANVSATAGSDYVASSLTGETIAAGQLSRTFSVTLNGDTALEANETFTVTLANAVGATLADAQGVGTITNDDSPTIGIGDVAVAEGNAGTKLATFTVTLSAAAPGPVTYNIATANGTATAGSDYVASSLTGETIAAGQLSRTFSVTLNGDTAIEANETYTVNLTAVSGATVADAQGLGTITNDDSPTITIFDASIAEGNAGTKTLAFSVRLSQASTSTVTFNVASSNDTATAGNDYVAMALANQPIVAGALTRNVFVTLNGDVVVEANEKFNLTLSNVVGATVADGAAVGTIINDDGPTLSIADVGVAEGHTGTKTFNFVAKLSQVAASNVTFNISTVAQTATAGTDYVTKAQTAQVIPAGQLTFPFNVTVNGDAVIEPNETFLVVLTAVTGPITVADDRGSGIIINDEGPTLSIADVGVSEGNSGTTPLVFTVKLSQVAAVPVSYSIATSGFTAVSGSDFVASTLSNQTIPAGQLAKTFIVSINGDTTAEQNEQFIVTLTNTVGASAFDDKAFGNILNDEGPVLSINDVAISEGNAGTKLMTFTVGLSPAAAGPVTYTIATANNTATAGTDYVASTLTGETIGAGATSKTFSVTLNGDTAVEANEVLAVNLSAPTGATIADAQGLGTLVNDDGPTLSIDNVAVTEGNAGTALMTFTVSLSQAAAGPVTYNIGTANGTATAGSDYAAKALVGESIPAGQLTRPFAVTINGDTTVETNETLTANLSGASGATIADAQGVGTIDNNDASALAIATAMDPAAIQGGGPVSAVEGRVVETDGVVTATTAGGFFLQSPTGDGDATTSDGVYVTALPATPVAVGDRVRARGTVQEVRVGDSIAQLTQTRLQAQSLVVLARGQALPAPVRPDPRALQPGAAATALERYEGMRIVLPAMTVVGPVGADAREAGDGRFHVVASGVPRPFREPGVSVLDTSAMAVGKQPPRFDANAEMLRVASAGQRGAMALAVDAGDTVSGLAGVLDYADARYQVLPDPGARLAVQASARPGAVSAAAPDEATIARFALDDFLAGTPRGDAAYRPRLAKAAQVLCRWLQAPAVVALPGSDDPAVLADLAAQASQPASGCATDPRYRVLAQKGRGLGLLLSQATVANGAPRAQLLAVGPFAATTAFVAPDGTRAPLFADAPQRLRLRLHAADGTPLSLTALAVRFTALDGGLAAPGTHGWRTRGDALRAQRRAQALLLARVVQARQRAAPGEALAVLGGFESPQFSEGHEHLLGIVTGRAPAPDRVLHAVASPVAPPLLNLTTLLPAAERYTTTTDGDAQALDHVLVNAGLQRAYTTRVQAARINADFGVDNTADATVPLRVGGRDPLVLYLSVRKP